MLGNLKLVLLQHKKFLVIFFIVVFLPSVVLAFFGIRAIHNERYKLQQQNRERQKGFVKNFRAGILSHIERNITELEELAAQEVVTERNFREIHRLISERLENGELFGHIVIWSGDGSPWFPEFQESPPFGPTFVVPDEWTKWRPEIEIAELAEFRRRNYSEAVSKYKKILDRAKDRQVKAWLLSRIARCEAKHEEFKQALNTYRSIVAGFPGLFTESGRPLELSSRLEMLDAFRSTEDRENFFLEALRTFQLLEQASWPLNGDQLKMYSDILRNMIDEMMVENAAEGIPDGFTGSIGDIQAGILKKMGVWLLAEAVGRDMARDIGGNQVQKDVYEYEDDEFLVITIPLSKDNPGPNSGPNREFLGSLMPVDDLKEAIDTQIKENGPSDGSLVIRSSLTNEVVFGNGDAGPGSAVISDLFPGNFPPWKLELYQTRDGESRYPLHQNIFFWVILALLVIVVFGSGLIIRTIVQEVNLLNLKSDFIASVSHEFKTPLTAMGAVLERLLSGEVKDPQKTRDYYRILSHDQDRLKRLVKNVLDFTKIEDGKREYKFAATDIVRLVRSEVDNFHNDNRLSGFTIETEVDANIPLVRADEEAMRQALHNILDNAAKFSGQQKNIQVMVTRRQTSVEIAVQDRGVGIREHEQKKVFEKFYRGKQASSISPTGTGLGLTLVKHIMDAHAGDVVISSRPGKGTRISLILPFGKGG